MVFNSEEWKNKLTQLISENTKNKLSFLGIGNPIKSDDAVGLYILSKLRKKHGANPKRFLKIVHSSSPERALSKIVEGQHQQRQRNPEATIIFDALESNSRPGTIIFANVRETRYGFFATHDIPLRLLSTVVTNSSKIFILGVQPANMDIGEKLSDVVLVSANLIIAEIGKLIESFH
jgi:hydrogenase 3 maturation protease